MTDHVDFYFEFSSPYGYFASTQIEALAAEFQRQVRWHPILLGPMFQATGSAPLVDVPVKGQYSLHDMKRTAKLFNIPFKQPDPFPNGTVSAAREIGRAALRDRVWQYVSTSVVAVSLQKKTQPAKSLKPT